MTTLRTVVKWAVIGSGLAMVGVILMFVLAAVLMGKADYDVDLPHGFRLVRANAIQIGIVNPDRTFAVHPHIERYTVLEDGIVTGFASPEAWDRVGVGSLAPIPPPRERAGYFIVDTRFRECWDELGEDEWRSVLHALGVGAVPELRPPSRRDRWPNTATTPQGVDHEHEETSCDRSTLTIDDVIQPTPTPRIHLRRG